VVVGEFEKVDEVVHESEKVGNRFSILWFLYAAPLLFVPKICGIQLLSGAKDLCVVSHI